MHRKPPPLFEKYVVVYQDNDAAVSLLILFQLRMNQRPLLVCCTPDNESLPARSQHGDASLVLFFRLMAATSLSRLFGGPLPLALFLKM